MRRLIVVVVVALVFAGAARAAVPNPQASAFYVVNATNGDVLAARNAHTKLPMASITKLMTVIVALDLLKPSDTVRSRQRPPRWGSPGSRCEWDSEYSCATCSPER
jgi:D-alanyl-D-alanine carboxypeptidase (penicillin-binding protein 5/6)